MGTKVSLIETFFSATVGHARSFSLSTSWPNISKTYQSLLPFIFSGQKQDIPFPIALLAVVCKTRSIRCKKTNVHSSKNHRSKHSLFSFSRPNRDPTKIALVGRTQKTALIACQNTSWLASYISNIQKSGVYSEVCTLSREDDEQTCKIRHSNEVQNHHMLETMIWSVAVVVVNHHEKLKTSRHQTVTVKHTVHAKAFHCSNV